MLPGSYYSELRGFAFFRNRWKDANDIEVTISADAYNAGIGWDSCGTLGLNLVAFNTRFFGEPEKGGGIAAYSTLLVDGKNTAGKASQSLGKPDTYEPAEDGGYADIEGEGELVVLTLGSATGPVREALARAKDDGMRARNLTNASIGVAVLGAVAIGVDLLVLGPKRAKKPEAGFRGVQIRF